MSFLSMLDMHQRGLLECEQLEAQIDLIQTKLGTFSASSLESLLTYTDIVHRLTNLRALLLDSRASLANMEDKLAAHKAGVFNLDDLSRFREEPSLGESMEKAFATLAKPTIRYTVVEQSGEEDAEEEGEDAEVETQP